MATRAPRRPRPAGARLSEMEAGAPATIFRITEEAEEDAGLLSYLEARALTPGPRSTLLARSEALGALPRDGPRGRATLGLRPAALIRVLPGEADPALSHHVPGAGGKRRPRPAPGSPRARPVRCTSGPPGRRCSTTCSRATPAAPSSRGWGAATRPAARAPTR